MSKTSISHIGHAHSDWLRSLKFYKDELRILKDRLTEIGGRNTGKDVALELEQYENRFTVQQDNINRLKHDINKHVEAMSAQAQENHSAGYIERELSERYLQLGQEFSAEEKAVNDLRHDFNRFSAEWM